MDTSRREQEAVPSLARLAEVGAGKVREGGPRRRLFFWLFSLVVCGLAGGLGWFGGLLITFYYQMPRIFSYRPLRLPGLETVGIIAGITAGLLAGVLWTRRWRRSLPAGLTIGRGTLWGTELGIMARVMVHAVVGPANFLMDSQPIRWGDVLGAALLLGLPFGALGGVVLGVVCAAGAKGVHHAA